MGSNASKLRESAIKSKNPDLPILLRANQSGTAYKDHRMITNTLICGERVMTTIPHARNIVALPLIELQGDKLTHVYRASRIPGQRTVIQRAFLKIDATKLVRFEIIITRSDSTTFVVAAGDMRDLKLWNSVHSNTSSHDMFELPALTGFMFADQDFRITMSGVPEPIVYVDTIIEDPSELGEGLGWELRSFTGMFLYTEFKRMHENREAILKQKHNHLLAFVVVQTGIRPIRIALVDGLSREIIGVPTDIARFDAKTYIAHAEDDQYCLILDATALNKKMYKDVICIGGALDLGGLEGDVYLSLGRDVGPGEEVHVMTCSWAAV